jgi:tRNA A-37 threonylcarbamoyl transferase component Bud32
MIGDRLGKWVIFKELGRGGMGRVYLAQEELSGNQAAIKVLAAELAQEVGFLNRFQREIDALAKLDHPGIVRFYESGCENGYYFYAMEYVEGLSLEQLLDEQSRFNWKDVLNVALQVAPALRHVHDHGIIHRDIKPSNLILNSQGHVKIMDFGIAKVFASNHLTATGGIVGTAEFLSPEQAAGKVVGKRSDLYCLGCVLYKLLTGRTPFVGNSYVELLHKHRYGQFDRPIKFVPDIPLEIDEMVCNLLEKDPDKRPRDAQVFHRQLEGIAKKLDRQGDLTSVDNRDTATKAENRTDKGAARPILTDTVPMNGSARGRGERREHDGILGRIFSRPTFLVLILLMCIGTIVYGFWPTSQDQLYERGAALMESGSVYDMRKAWTEYLEPLETRYPDHPYKEKVAEFRRKWEAAQMDQPSEAQRFYYQADALARQGNAAAAQQTWRSLIDVFEEVESEKIWVANARRSLRQLEIAAQHKNRFTGVKTALTRAEELRAAGQVAEAERIWKGIEQLYAADPTANDIILAVQKARGK